MLTDLLIYHFASGQVFFSGCGFILAAIAISFRILPGWGRRLRNVGVAVGAIFVVCSATPFHPAVYALLAVGTVGWLLCERLPRTPRRWRTGARLLAAAGWLAAAACELPQQFLPVVPRVERPILGVIADSLTAGVGDPHAETWPQILAEAERITVHDHSVMGATVASARRQAAELTAEETVVLLEIGGNDLLGGTSVGEFERGLAALLRDVCRPGRGVVMFELPLPPFYNEFGRIQRRLARAHGVALIPKWVLLGVLRGQAATLDSIHLSPAGQREMARSVWSVIGPAFSPR